jgi:BioD-like phosphotransacetylase family protein
MHPHKEDIHAQITKHYKMLEKGKDFILIEGTGHAGVGSVFDASNADVAKLLGSKVVLVSLGGIGRSIDEIILNKACFDLKGVEILGVIINKVKSDKYDKTVGYLEKGLAQKGLKFLGAVPYVKSLSRPLMKQLQEGLDAKILSGEDQLENRVGKVLIGAMDSTDALDYFEKDTVLVVPGNREAIIMTALFGNLLKKKVDFNISGIVFTGGIGPDEKIFKLIKHTKIPMLLVPDDSYSVATRINTMLVKVRAEETEKIQEIQSLVERYVNVDEICRNL